MAEWYICDGADPWWVSPCIIVKNSQVVLTPDPYTGDPGPHEDPIAGQDNWIYVRVAQIGTFDPLTEMALLKVCVGRGGPLFVWNSLTEVQVEPGWGNVQGNNVVPIGTTVDMRVPGMAPGSTLARWYELKWYKEFVPPAGLNWHPCLLAYVDNGLPSTAGIVPEDDAFAQRNIVVLGGRKNQKLRRSVKLGNQSSTAGSLGVVVGIEGPAAEDAEVELRFPDGQGILERVAVPHLPPDLVPHLPLGAIKRRRLPPNAGFNVLLNAPAAWNVAKTEGGLAFVKSAGGFSMPVAQGEMITADVEILPRKEGRLVVHVIQFGPTGHVEGGFTFEVHVAA